MTELLVVLFVASLIVGISFSTYSYSEKLFREWDRKARTIRLVNGAVQILATDFRRAKDVTLVSDSIAFFTQIDGRKVVYHFEKGNIIRNDIALNIDPSIMTTVRILTTSAGYTVVVTAVSTSQTAFAQADVQQLESSASIFRASLSDASAN